MKCQRKYQWVKLPRNCLPQGKGVLGRWARLAARAAYRKGIGTYCGYENEVLPGMWAGGVVGLKSILGTRSRRAALETLEQLQELGYLSYSLDHATKKLEYTLLDWVANCSGQACRDQGVYALQGTGFLCLPRDIPDRLVGRVFEEADAWLDLWCHTVWQEPKNIFSHLAPAVQFGHLGAVLTLEILGSRWGWEKTKVWRFFKKHEDAFPLYRLPGAYGCLVFNAQYPTQQSVEGMGHPLPAQEEILSVLEKLRQCGGTAQVAGNDNLRLNKMTLWYSPHLLEKGRKTTALHFLFLYYARIFLRVGNGRSVRMTARKKVGNQGWVTQEATRPILMERGRYPMKDQNKTNRLETKKMTDLMELLKAQGILADEEITDEEQRKLQQERRKRLYHNTRVLLENYRDIAWALECFPDTVAEELDVPFQPLDVLLDRMDAEGCMGNRKLESRVESVRKSRLLLDRVNEALTILRKKPGNGARLYELIYLSYIAPEKLSHTDLLFRLDLSSRQFYRLRDQAIDVIAVRLRSITEI